MSKEIALSKRGYKYRGLYSATVDDEDYDRINAYAWSYVLLSGRSYAITTLMAKGKQRQVLMHRMVLRAKIGDEIDHIDGDGLNNSRANLRRCTHAQNLANSGARCGKKYKGVHMAKSGLFSALIRHNGVDYYLGLFQSEEEAAKAYNIKALELNGRFARLNILPDNDIELRPVTRHRYRYEGWI